jgi:hypothetical protein
MTQTFEEKFPELKDKMFNITANAIGELAPISGAPLLCYSTSEGSDSICSMFSLNCSIHIKDIEKHCLSKQRVKEALERFEKYHFDEESDHPSMPIHYSDFISLKEELGLNEE